MNKLTVIEQNGNLLTNSREVADMIDKPHNDLMKSIRQYCEYLTEGKISLSDFFIESTYLDSTGRTLPCYLLTKKGCDMVANKLTGQKGVLFTAAYVNAFEQMREHITKGAALPDSMKQALAEAKILNAKARVASQWMKLPGAKNNPEYHQICAYYASTVLAGKPVLPLPESGEKHLSAKEVGDLFGISAQKVGTLANANHLKTDEFGKWYHDKSRYSSKEVDTFKYNQAAVGKFAEILGRNGQVTS